MSVDSTLISSLEGDSIIDDGTMIYIAYRYVPTIINLIPYKRDS